MVARYFPNARFGGAGRVMKPGAPLRVSFVLPDFFAGGAQRVLLTFASGLDRARFDPGVVVLNGQGPWKEKFASGLTLTDLQTPRVRSALPALVRALRAARPDIVVSTMSYLNFAVLMARPWLDRGTRIVVREANTPWSTAAGAFRLPASLAYSRLYRKANRIISPSHLIARELTRDFRVPERRISVLRNPVDTRTLRAAASPPRRQNGDGRRFVAVGRLSQQKGYDRLIRIMAEYETEGHVTILGEGPERGTLGRMIAQAGLGERITLAGFDADPSPWIAGADALLLPSRWEGLPNVTLEALALGTPVIAAPEAGGIGEIADEAEAGAVTLAAPGTEFAAAMNAVAPAAQPSLRASMLPGVFEKKQATEAFARLLLDEAAA